MFFNLKLSKLDFCAVGKSPYKKTHHQQQNLEVGEIDSEKENKRPQAKF